MKKIIGGKRYDTETAHFCGSDQYGGPRDFHYWREELYRKTTGEFFLHGEGGAMSKYAISAGQNEWSGGEKIIPLSPAKAKEWAEEHLSGEEYEAVFGPVEDDGTKTLQMLSLPASTVEKLKRKAGERGMSLSDLATEILEGAL